MNHLYRITHETVVEDNHPCMKLSWREPVEERLEYTELELKYRSDLIATSFRIVLAKWNEP